MYRNLSSTLLVAQVAEALSYKPESRESITVGDIPAVL
jgi:hypothetical protein